MNVKRPFKARTVNVRLTNNIEEVDQMCWLTNRKPRTCSSRVYFLTAGLLELALVYVYWSGAGDLLIQIYLDET